MAVLLYILLVVNSDHFHMYVVVAELQTPLHAISICLDTVMEDVTLIDGSVVETLKSCQVSTSFMSMAINRVVDFAKSASNVALLPKKETVSVSNVIQWAVHCVKSSLHGTQQVSIIVKPVAANFCDFVVTDKYWCVNI